MWVVRGPDRLRKPRTYRVLENALNAHLAYPGSVLESVAQWPRHELEALWKIGRKRKARQARLANISAQTALAFTPPQE